MIKRFIASAVIFVAGFALCVAVYGGNLGSLAKGLLARPDSPTITTQGALRGLPQWEYRVVTKQMLSIGGNEDYGLNALGAQGFEVVGVSQSSVVAAPNIYHYLTVVLRRPKP
jgi:hypothetical protein